MDGEEYTGYRVVAWRQRTLIVGRETRNDLKVQFVRPFILLEIVDTHLRNHMRNYSHHLYVYVSENIAICRELLEIEILTIINSCVLYIL